jgi:hypothetical protein
MVVKMIVCQHPMKCLILFNGNLTKRGSGEVSFKGKILDGIVDRKK